MYVWIRVCVCVYVCAYTNGYISEKPSYTSFDQVTNRVLRPLVLTHRSIALILKKVKREYRKLITRCMYVIRKFLNKKFND